MANGESAEDFSPDGTLVAYQSWATGRPEVFVDTFPEKGERKQVTTSGGVEPMWRADGRELFFLSSRNELWRSIRRAGGTVRFRPLRVLFKLQNPPNTVRRYVSLPSSQGLSY